VGKIFKPQEKEYIIYTIHIKGSFNPSIIDQVWMKEYNLMGENESVKLKNFYFTDTAVQFETIFFSFQCDTERLSVYVKTFEASNVVDSFVKGILSLLGHTKLQEAKVIVHSHLVAHNKNKMKSFFSSFADISLKESLKIDRIEDYIFWSNDKKVLIGKCPTDKNHLFLKITKQQKFEASIGSTDECIDFLDENEEFRNESIDYIINVKEMIT